MMVFLVHPPVRFSTGTSKVFLDKLHPCVETEQGRQKQKHGLCLTEEVGEERAKLSARPYYFAPAISIPLNPLLLLFCKLVKSFWSSRKRRWGDGENKNNICCYFYHLVTEFVGWSQTGDVTAIRVCSTYHERVCWRVIRGARITLERNVKIDLKDCFKQ